MRRMKSMQVVIGRQLRIDYRTSELMHRMEILKIEWRPAIPIVVASTRR